MGSWWGFCFYCRVLTAYTDAMPLDERSDLELVAAAKAGSLDAMETLVSRHEQRVYGLAMRLLQNSHDAEDVTQQTFLSVVENLESFRGESAFLTWVLRIATHAALKVIRKRKGLDTVSLEQATEPDETYDTIPHPEFIADWRENPETLAQRGEVRRQIDAALAALDEKYRVVFILRDVEGLSVEETAQTLGISEANVKVRLLRARLQLREQLTRVLGDAARRMRPHDH